MASEDERTRGLGSWGAGRVEAAERVDHAHERVVESSRPGEGVRGCDRIPIERKSALVIA